MHQTSIKSISLFMLLDLLGAANPTIPSYFKNTHWAYQNLAEIESRMRKLDLLQSNPPSPFLPEVEKRSYHFVPGGYVLDDHVPFMNRGVDILHVIPTPFPSVWHKMEDDAEHLDAAALQDWAKLVTAFAAEWMELDGLFVNPIDMNSEREQKDEL